MKKMMRFFLLALLVLALALAHGAAKHLPVPPDGIAQQKYAGWSGVLRLWVLHRLADRHGFARHPG